MTRSLRPFLGIIVAAALLALLPLRFGDTASTMGVFTDGLTFACYAVAFNVIFGSSGQLFLCVGALAGVGGYSSAILTEEYGAPLLVGLVIGPLVATLVGTLLGWIAVKRSLGTIFVGVITLTFSLAFHNLLLGLRDLIGGETGLRVAAGGDTFLRRDVAPFYVFLGVLVAFLVIYTLVERSRVGWAFRALRDDHVAAELAGVDVSRYRVLAVAIGAAMLGAVGALSAHSGSGFIGPSTFEFGDVDIPVIVMLALGGIGSRLGPLIGAVILTMIDELLVDYNQLRLVFYGTVLVVLFLGFRDGVAPALSSAWSRLRTRT